MKSMLCVLLICLLTGSAVQSLPARAAEAEPQADEPQETQVPAPAPSDPPRRPAAGADPEVFVPTEEISEDFAVSFPVDI